MSQKNQPTPSGLNGHDDHRSNPKQDGHELDENGEMQWSPDDLSPQPIPRREDGEKSGEEIPLLDPEEEDGQPTTGCTIDQ
jgi:hypothetical protein